MSTSLPRDEAIAKILSNKDVQWKVNTVIIKGNDVVYSTTKENEKEGINQEFNVANLQKDQQYTITKTKRCLRFRSSISQTHNLSIAAAIVVGKNQGALLIGRKCHLHGIAMWHSKIQTHVVITTGNQADFLWRKLPQHQPFSIRADAGKHEIFLLGMRSGPAGMRAASLTSLSNSGTL